MEAARSRGFQSRGRDLLIGKHQTNVSGNQPQKVSVPWSGFINRKVSNVNLPETYLINVSVPWSGFINRKAGDPRSVAGSAHCFSPVVGIY